MKIKETEFTVVDLSSTVGPQTIELKMRITPKHVSFNNTFCKKLGYPPYVDMYVNTGRRKVAFKALSKKTGTCRNFYQPRKKQDSASGVNWSGKKIVNAMNKIFKQGNYSGELVDGFIIFKI